MLTDVNSIPWYNSWWEVLGGIMVYVPAFTLTPRLVLSLRQLYARDVRGGPRGDIDTGFGLTSMAGHCSIGSVIIFAERGQNGDEEQSEGMEMEER